jgi:NAD(P)-dependent dehydrogenase (short-subunit alcohol dehydrogenase family)
MSERPLPTPTSKSSASSAKDATSAKLCQDMLDRITTTKQPLNLQDITFLRQKIMEYENPSAKLCQDMLDRITTNKQPLNLQDITFLRQKIKEYENQSTGSCGDKTSTLWLGNAIQIILIVFLALFSGIPTKLGLFRFIATHVPETVGMTPAFNYGVVDGYTFEQLDGLDLSGQKALVTGGNSGVGYECAHRLIELGADVTILCRNQTKCDEAAKKINGGDRIHTLIADLSNLKSTRQATEKYAATIDSLDMLFFNAGIHSVGEAEDGSLLLSDDGIEKVFHTNVIGHHAMWKYLEPKIKASGGGRVVVTSSNAHFRSYDHGVATSLQQLNAASTGSHTTYGQSKLAQILWVKKVTRQLGADSTVYVNAYHPGSAATNIWYTNKAIPTFLHPVVRFFQKNVMWSSLDGALTMLYLGAAAEDIKGGNIRGKYFHPQVQEVAPNPQFANDETLQDQFWAFADGLIEQ